MSDPLAALAAVAATIDQARRATVQRIVITPDTNAGTVALEFYGRDLELRLHPDDWSTILKARPVDTDHAVRLDGVSRSLYGLPVLERAEERAS